jgi:signal transduction histidine kinase/CheY-like chemotaxis protein
MHRILRANRLIRNSRLVTLIGFALLAAAGVALILGLTRSREADMLVLHTLEVEQVAQTTLIAVRDGESAIRGFLLSGDKADYDRFEPSIALANEKVAVLKDLTADNAIQRARVASLENLIQSKGDRLRKCAQLAKDGQRDEALAIINAPEDRETLDNIRAEIASVLSTEQLLLKERQDDAARQRYVLAALIGLALLTATVLAAVLAMSTRNALKGLIDLTSELDAESKLRHEAESTLRQAHKMEAVGQLTGGIAHDFNNLLTIIIGNLDTMRRQLAAAMNPGDVHTLIGKMTKPLDSAIQGARSAAQLTQRLLAFSRRQALEPVRLDLNRLITGMLDLLRRTLGEDISIETVFAAGLWPVHADAHQVENVLLNLALNAKDAMPEGGCLTIETANTYLDDAYVRRFGDVAAGQYVVMCVTDTGTGIAKDVLDQVFEPFFTTKPHGEGSGLGLAMVHGFVKQSGGHVRIYSEIGKGTTVKVYLPRPTQVEEPVAVPSGKPDAELAAMPKAKPSEVVLLVEDSDGVRAYAKSVLEDLGYWVLEADNAEAAMRAAAKKPRIDLLFTDVVLPGASGRELADQIRRLYPHIPVLYTTGYTRNAIVHQGRLDLDVHLLNKPYTQQELAHKVRELLDRA